MSSATPCPATSFAWDAIRSNPRLSSDTKLFAEILDGFPGQVCWLGWKESARRAGWHLKPDGQPVADLGRKRQGRALAELVKEGLARVFRRGQFWRWFKAIGAALGIKAPATKGCPSRFVILGWRLDQPIPAAPVGDTHVPKVEPVGDAHVPNEPPHEAGWGRSCPQAGDAHVPKLGTPMSPTKSLELSPEGRTSRAPEGADPVAVVNPPASTDARTGGASLSSEDSNPPALGVLARLARLAASLPEVSPEESPKGSPVAQGRSGSRPAPTGAPKPQTPQAVEVRRIALEVSQLGPQSPRSVPAELATALAVAVGDPHPAETARYWTATLELAADEAISSVELGAAIEGASLKRGRLWGSPYKGISARFRRIREAAGIAPPARN